MESKLRKYDAYKSSGVEWLGEIPQHWEVKRFKFLSNIQKGKLPKKITNENDLNNLPQYLSMEYLRGGEENQWVLDKEAIVIENDEVLLLWDGSNAGEFIKSKKGVISSTVAHIIFSGIRKEFAWYFSKSLEIELRKKTIGMGIPHVNGTELKNFQVVYPSLSEQTAIAKFLGDKTQKIDQAIRLKEEQIALLRERRQILIHKAVTRGLDKTVKLKDSGVEWIGEIPDHWEVKRLASFGKFSKGGGFSKADLTEEGVPAILYGDIYTKYDIAIKKGVRFVSQEQAKKSILIKYNSLLFTGSGETMEDIGKCVVFLSNEKTVAGGDVIIYQQNENNSQLLSYILNTEGAKFEKARYSKGEIIVHTYGSKLKNIYVPIPPKREQDEISHFIDNATAKIATSIFLKEKEIDKLKEYKVSLINSVVTGKVKVI